jgi:hypothetical protein
MIGSSIHENKKMYEVLPRVRKDSPVFVFVRSEWRNSPPILKMKMKDIRHIFLYTL